MITRNSVRIAVFLCFGMITVFGSMIAISASELFLFTEYLRVEEYTSEDPDSLSTKVFQGDVHVANVHICFESPLPQGFDVPVQISIWHTEETELDSVSLTLTGADYLDFYLEAPTASWPPYTFRRAKEGRGAIFHVENLGLHGTGTVVIRFLLKNLSHHSSFDFEARCSLHTKAFLQLTRQELWTYREIPLPT
jgi:hypothetical protein